MMNRLVPILSLCCLAAACAGETESEPDAPEAQAPADVEPSVRIAAPTDGQIFEDPEFEVILESTVPIVPAGDMTPGTGHHHLYLDADLGDLTEPIPTVEGSVVHMGDASSAFMFEDVSSGPHRLIAVVADGAHIPLQPLVVDTVYFVVE